MSPLPLCPHRFEALARRSLARTAGSLLILLATVWFAPGALAATGTCGAATGQGADGPSDYPTYCWIDFTNFNGTTASSAGGQNFTITLSGGSTLSFTLTISTVYNTGGATVTGGGLKATTVPTWTGAAFGQAAFTGVPGNPSLYQTTNATTTTVTLSNIVLTVGSGTVPYAIVAADAESTNNAESLSFTTNGNAWTLLSSMQNGSSTTYPTLSGVGTGTVTETGVAGTVGAYAFATEGSPTTISSTMVGGGLQGIAFAVKYHAADFAITSGHTGNFNLGGTGSYTLAVTNDGPDSYPTPDTITVTDTLPTGLTYVSASGTGWSCGDAGQVVTCTTSATVASGGSLPNITVNVSVGYTTATTLTNTATVATNPNLDFNTSNNTATDPTTLVDPDLSTSTKGVAIASGGDALVGGVLEYTITLTETAGVAAINVSVTDEVPANVSNFTVTSTPTGSTNSSTGSGTGTNSDGYLNITGVSVPANGSVSITFTVKVATGTANCQSIPNTATVTNPYGNGATPAAPTVVVDQSACASSGNKILYAVDSGPTLTRTKPTTNGTGVLVTAGGGTATWTLSPVLVENLVLSAQTVSVTLIVQNMTYRTGNNRALTVSLYNGNTLIGTSGGCTTCNSATPTAIAFSVSIPATTISAGGTLNMRVTNPASTNGGSRDVDIFQMNASTGTTVSSLTVSTTTVINVDSIGVYNATYPNTTTQGVYMGGNTIYVCAVVSDPFGTFDIDPGNSGVPQVTISEPNGTVVVNAANMTLNNSSGTPAGGTHCTGLADTVTFGATTYAVGDAYEYTYTLPANAPMGNWLAYVIADEGKEGTITASGNASFDVSSLVVSKAVAVASDPAEGSTRAKAIPGATVQYSITVQNNGSGTADSGSLVITDPVPANTVFDLTGATPFTFTNGSATSGLSAPVMTFSNNGGTSYAYTPTCARPCTDSAITNIKLTFTGGVNGKTGSTAPSFTVSFDVIIQ